MAKADKAAAAKPQQIVWEPQPRQAAFITCPADDVGFGGARGGGKSDSILGDWLSHEEQYGQDAIGLILRRERTQLIELIERAKILFLPLGYKYKDVDKVFVGPKGGRVRFAYLESDSDADGYQGHSYTRLYFEEGATFPSEGPVNKLQATLRSGAGVPCQLKLTANPGGPGHHWVKSRYKLDAYPGGMELFKFQWVNPFTKEKIEKTRIFIPSKVSDNKYLDSSYVASLFQVGSPELVRAWLEGDWSVVQGSFFPEWSSANIVEPFTVPDEWLRFRSIDWGSASPFSVGWWGVCNDDLRLEPGRTIPRGALVRYREWYGASAPNVGLRLTAGEVADGIKDRTRDEKIAYSVMDPSAFSVSGGPSIAETFFMHRIDCRPADNRRVAKAGSMSGWDQLRARIKGVGGVPMLYVFNTCKALIRTLPAMQHDPSRMEDVDTDSEDHAVDEARYAVMSRPWTPQRTQHDVVVSYSPAGEERVKRPRNFKYLSEMTYNEFHAATGSEIGKNRRRKRTWV
jgi:hypothetical protein